MPHFLTEMAFTAFDESLEHSRFFYPLSPCPLSGMGRGKKLDRAF